MAPCSFLNFFFIFSESISYYVGDILAYLAPKYGGGDLAQLSHVFIPDNHCLFNLGYPQLRGALLKKWTLEEVVH